MGVKNATSWCQGEDPKEFAVNGSTKVRWCPFLSGALIPKSCDGDKCQLFLKYQDPINPTRIIADCALVIDVKLLLASMGSGVLGRKTVGT